jgi:hypothetical protein
MDIEDVEDVKPPRKSKRSSQSCSAASSTSGPKIKQEDFSPRSLRLANGGKSAVRERIALVDGFPKDKKTFIWESIKAISKDNDILEGAVNAAQEDVLRKDDLITYA